MSDSRETDLDVHAWITLRMHTSGAMSVAGNIGDEKLALSMLDGAREAIRSAAAKRAPLVVLPNHETSSIKQDPAYPTRERSRMKPEDRGDL